MIAWPDEDALNDAAKRHMRAFKKTAVAKEFDEDEKNWVFHSFARMPDPPVRMILQDETSPNETVRPRVTITMDERGVWYVRR